LKFVINGNELTTLFSTIYVETPRHSRSVALVETDGSPFSFTHKRFSLAWKSSIELAEAYVQLGQYKPKDVFPASNNSQRIGVLTPLA